MILDILPLAGGTARFVGVRRRALREAAWAVPAPEGEGQWPITELGDYCFSEKPRGLPGPEKICRYERAEDGKLCLTRAFGRDVSGKERYSLTSTPCRPGAGRRAPPHLRELPGRSHPCRRVCGSSAAAHSTTAAGRAA